MKFNRLRLAGFKSFCESTDFNIEPGLTGVVGPNGCGKSNLVEAMRWVMGENSYKNMRASGMDDVIFSGSGNRPSRNTAEVALVLDNSDRTAPAAFNDAEIIEVTRKIEREEGSTYRINGKEVRARDIQLLFADASTGARSPAMVRQGQIGEIISAKPQQRRRILEEAAGVAGLHSRRHEAELRLKGADDNLRRLEDVLKQIDEQIVSLNRQARQASRYKNLAADIRRNEALLLHISHKTVSAQLANAEHALEESVREVAERTRQQAEAARLQAIAAYQLPPLREDESKASAVLQRLVLARDQLESEEKRAKDRSAELERRIHQLTGDLAREKSLIDDAAGVLAKLDAEAEDIERQAEDSAENEFDSKAKLADAEGALAESEKALVEAQAAISDLNSRRQALDAALRDETQRLARFEAELAKVSDELAALKGQATSDDEMEALAEAAEIAAAAVEESEQRAFAAESQHQQMRDIESASRGPLADAEKRAHRLEAEVRTLTNLLASAASDLWPPVVEEMSVEKGYEAALGAALGDDLDASTNPSAPAHWSVLGDPADDPVLPPGVQSLGTLVAAPAPLARRLAQIGIVMRAEGAQLQKLLKVGQRLVSKEGDLWRWDGFTAAAEAPTPAAKRLTEKNRLVDLRVEAEIARGAADEFKAKSDHAQQGLRAAAAAEAEARNALRIAQRSAQEARDRAADGERRRGQIAARVSALAEAQSRLSQNCEDARIKQEGAQTALEGLAAPQQLINRLERMRAQTATKRAEAAEARAAVQGMIRDAEQRMRRREAIVAERASWDERRNRAGTQIEALETRLEEAREEQEQLVDAPELFLDKRRGLMNEIEAAEVARKEAADRRAEAETALAEGDRAARLTLDAMAAVREQRARVEAQVEGLRARLDAVVKTIATDLECPPEGLMALAGVKPGDDLPEAEKI